MAYSPTVISTKVNYYNREEALLARDGDAEPRLGGITFSIDEAAYKIGSIDFLEGMLMLGAINISEYERLVAKFYSSRMKDWLNFFLSKYGIIPGSSGGEIVNPGSEEENVS